MPIHSNGCNKKNCSYIVGYVHDLIVADRSNQNHVSKQIMDCIQKYWKVSDEGTLTRYLGIPSTDITEHTDANRLACDVIRLG